MAAVTISFSVTKSSDNKSLYVQDAGTLWSSGGDMDKIAVTGISLNIFGADNETPLKSVVFTADERTAFLAGSVVTLLFSDYRLFSPSTIPPDNFYNCQLAVTGGSVVLTQVSFDSNFYIKSIVMNAITSVDVPIETHYEANRKIVGDLVALLELEYLGTVASAARENKYRKVMSFLVWNHNV